MHIFGPGDIVAVFRSGEDDSQTKDAEKTKEGKPKKNAELSGVVYRVSHDSLVIAFDDERMELDDGESIEYHAIKLTNDLTFRRMRAALDRLACDRFRSSSLVDALFGEFDSTAARLELNDLEFSAVFKCSPETLPFANGNLDESQRDAVRFALRQRYVAIVHGPPGTGKTTTLIEIISQLVRSGQVRVSELQTFSVLLELLILFLTRNHFADFSSRFASDSQIWHQLSFARVPIGIVLYLNVVCMNSVGC